MSFKTRTLATLIFALICIGCSKQEISRQTRLLFKDPIDREINLSRDEFKTALRPSEDKALIKDQLDYKTISNLDHQDMAYSPVILAPDLPDIASSKQVSLSVTEDVPIKDVLVELAQLADMELALDANIEGGIILKVKDRPVKDVIQLVADQAGLRYSVENGVLHVKKDGSYIQTYNVDYINFNRSSQSSISLQTQVLSSDSNSGNSSSSSSSSSQGSNNSGLTSGSTNQISSNYDGDVWKSVEENLKQIIGSVNQVLTRNISSKNSASEVRDTITNFYFIINKQAGIITVMADSKKQQAVKKYLDSVRASMSAQVLIEAKIVEVTLNEQYTAGINWSKIGKGSITGAFNYTPSGYNSNFLTGVFSGQPLSEITRTSKEGNINAVAALLEGFGTTRTLSSPRISAMNNQQAVLTFAQNKPYFTVTGTAATTSGSTITGTAITQAPTITSTLHTIPIGIILTMQPSINMETQEITMNVRPTLSRTVAGGDVQDPAVAILANGIKGVESKIPTVEVREMDTVLKIKSGDIMVIGGMMQHADSNSDAGLPGLNRIPILGNLAKQVNKSNSVQETVILIQARIVPSQGYYHEQDKKVYQTFVQDTRPLTFQ